MTPDKSFLTDALNSGLVLTGATYMRSLADRGAPASLTTHVPALDDLQGGGLKAGSLIGLSGEGTGGRLSLELAAMAAATGEGDAVAFLDCAGHFDPQQAAAAGVNLERLLWLAPRDAMQAFLSAELLMQAGFYLVIIDFGLRDATARTPNAVWLRLARAAQEHRSIVMVSGRGPLSALAADALLTAEGTRVEWRGSVDGPRLLESITVRMRLRARANGRPDHTAFPTFMA